MTLPFNFARQAVADELSEDDLVDGYSAEEVFGGKAGSCCGYTYDDIIVLPGHINFGVDQVVKRLACLLLLATRLATMLDKRPHAAYAQAAARRVCT